MARSDPARVLEKWIDKYHAEAARKIYYGRKELQRILQKAESLKRRGMLDRETAKRLDDEADRIYAEYIEEPYDWFRSLTPAIRRYVIRGEYRPLGISSLFSSAGGIGAALIPSDLGSNPANILSFYSSPVFTSELFRRISIKRKKGKVNPLVMALLGLGLAGTGYWAFKALPSDQRATGLTAMLISNLLGAYLGYREGSREQELISNRDEIIRALVEVSKAKAEASRTAAKIFEMLS